MMEGTVFGKYLKLTKSKLLLKTADNKYIVLEHNDNKRLFLDDDDIDVMLRRMIDGVSDFQYGEKMADAILKKYVVKYCADKDYYAIADKRNFLFVMGLKKETICKIIDYYKAL
jgi:hypothetical protein